MSDKYGECYCGDCISFNKCKSDKGTRINLVSEGCSCFEPNDIAAVDYPILPKWLAEHDKQIWNDAIEEVIKTLAKSEDIMLSDAQYYTLEQLKGEENDISGTDTDS